MVFLAKDKQYSAGYSAIFGEKPMRDGIVCQCCGTLFSDDEEYLEKKPQTKCFTCGTPYKHKCGCGRHFLEHKEKFAVYEKSHWKLSCLFMKKDKRMTRILTLVQKLKKEADNYKKMRLKFIRMKNYIKEQSCPKCGLSLGNRFHLLGEDLVCGNCWNYK